MVTEAIGQARVGNIPGTLGTRERLAERMVALLAPGRTWGQSGTRAVTDAEQALGVSLGTAERPIVDSARDATAAAAALDPATPPGIEPLLRTLHAARANLVDYARETAWRLDRLSTSVADALGAPDQASTLNQAAQLPGDPQADPVAVTAAIPDTLRRFRAQLETSIEAVLPGADEEIVEERRALMNEGKFVEAAQRTREEMRKRERRTRIASTLRDATPAGAVQPAPAKSPAVSVDAPVQQFVIEDRKEPAVIRQVQALHRLVRTRILRGATAAVIAAAGATLLYYDAFVGTASEILGLAAVGFMSDFTFESAIDAILKRKG
jgi:hypothetical protein